MRIDLDAVYTTNEVVKLLKVSKPTLLTRMKRGEIKTAGKNGRAWIVKGNDLYQYMLDHGMAVELAKQNASNEMKQLKLQELSILIDIAKAKYEIEQSPKNLLAWKNAELELVRYKIKLCEGGEV